MSTALESRQHAASLLIAMLVDQAATGALSDDTWDVLVCAARSSRLLGVLGARVEANPTASVPAAVRAVLRSEQAVTRYRTRMVWWELDRLARALEPLHVPIILLKGAAYLIQRLPCAAGRALADVDILVPRERTHDVEQALLAYGWEAKQLEPYDDRYYREWSHELPPLRYGGGLLELDVHHAILPPLGRIRIDTAALWNHSVATDHPSFRVLAPADQVLHAALHVFQDSDCTNRLRDIADVDALLREFGRSDGFWQELLRHAAMHGAERPLWYAVRFAKRLLGTPVPAVIETQLNVSAPPFMVRRFMDSLVLSALPPPDPDRGYSRRARIAGWMLMLRSVWLRFPRRLFMLHSLAKAVPWLRHGAIRTQPM
jgi:hypothetical protein